MNTKIHSFIKGMHSNFDEQNQPDGTYRDAYNWIRKEDGSLTNESGTIKVLSYPNNYTVIGSCVLGEEIILFSYYETLDRFNRYVSVVGVLDKNNNYADRITTKDFAFTRTTRVIAESRLDYRGHRITYFCSADGSLPLRRLDLDSIPSTNIAETTLNILESKLPVVVLNSVTEEGSLPTGVYQLSARLVTSGGDKTSPGFLTDIIPITNESIASGVGQFDGALPQTPSFKAIKVDVSNIDTKYKFIEIICTTYQGLTNTVKSNVVGIRTIQGESLSFTYSSLEQNGEELTLDEITVEPIEYTNPKTITQKDGRLLLGNLSAKLYNPDFQAIANNIVVKYTIKNLEYYEVINVDTNGGVDNGIDTFSYKSYDGEEFTTNFKGYQRDEVYSFAIAPIFKNGSTGYAYHIPGRIAGEDPNVPADTTTRLLGTYFSQESLYPEGYGYPIGPVRYHRMPTIVQEPILDNNTFRMRALGLEFSNINITDPNIVGYAITRELRTDSNKSILAQGIVNPLINELGGTNDPRMVSPWSGKSNYKHASGMGGYQYKELAFYSPETTIWNSDMLGATHIDPIGVLTGRAYMVGSQRSGADNTRYAHMFLNYTNIWEGTNYSKVALNRSATQYVYPGGVDSPNATLNGTNVTVTTKNNNGFLYLESLTNTPTYENMSTYDAIEGNGELTISSDVTAKVRFNVGGTLADQDDAGNQGETRRNIFNIVAERTNQYGGVLYKDYILIGYKLNRDTSITCYGGDTFINKSSLVSTTRDSFGRDFRTLNYFFCESSINTAYRHYIPNQTIAYYPKVKKFWTPLGDGILQVEPYYGHANGYNKQYSFENTIKRFYSKPILLEEQVTKFSNRIIYSEQAIEGEQSDAYRLFLTNNYHDIPKSKGEITNLFIQKGSLYIHTTQSIWKSFFNENVTQASSSGEVTLGNGGIFPRPSLEVFPISGGYAGTLSPLGSCNTPFGYFFIDGLQKKVFCLGETFEEIDLGMGDKLATLLPSKLSSAYDYENDRWILSGLDFTISFSPKLKSWTSWHSYKPGHLQSVNQKVLICTQNQIGVLNRGAKGEYFGEEAVDSTITIVTNDNPLVTKSFDNIAINSTSSIMNDTFSEIDAKTQFLSVSKDIVVNDDYDYVPASHEQQCVRRNDEFRLAVPIYEDELDESRLKGKWGSFKLSYYNLNNYNFVVKYINVTYRPVSR